MTFTLTEKLAIAKALEELMKADEKIDKNEISYLAQIAQTIGFDVALIKQSREMNLQEAISALQGMTAEKKSILALMMHEMSKADGEISDSEIEVIASVLIAAGIDITKGEAVESEFDLDDIYFVSSDHIRYQNGKHVSGPHGGARRAVKVEPNISGKEGYTLTIFNLDGNHPVWGNNVQMAPKQMKVKEAANDKTVLIGWGADPKAGGHPDGEFSNYGATIFHPNNSIEKIIVHMHDRKVDLEYLK